MNTDLPASPSPSLLCTIGGVRFVPAPADTLAFLRAHPSYVPTGEEVSRVLGWVDVADANYRAASDASKAAHRASMIASRPVDSSEAVNLAMVAAWDTLLTARAAVSLCESRRASLTTTF